MHTFRVQAKGNQLNFDTCLSRHISDKPDSKALNSSLLPCADLTLANTNTLESWR